MYCFQGQFRNFTFKDKGIIDSLCHVPSRARHVVDFLSKLTGRPNRVATLKHIGSLGGPECDG